MGVPATKQPQTPLRALSEYTVGEPDKRVDLSSASSAPNLAGSTATAIKPYLIGGIDYQTSTATIAAQVGAATVTTVVTVQFKNLPTPFSPNPADKVQFLVRPDITTNINGMAIGGWTVTPKSYSLGATYPGLSPQGGVTYSSFTADITVILVCAAATGSGTLTVGASGVLYVLPG